jgi:WXG100 family type VII secretion target
MAFHWHLRNCVAPFDEVSWLGQIGAVDPLSPLVASIASWQKGSPVPQPIKVDHEELANRAARMRDDVDALQDRHRSSVTAAGDAQSGLVGRSAQSISAKVQRWQATTTELHRVLTSQADALSSAAAAYARTEENNRGELESLDPTNL